MKYLQFVLLTCSLFRINQFDIIMLWYWLWGSGTVLVLYQEAISCYKNHFSEFVGCYNLWASCLHAAQANSSARGMLMIVAVDYLCVHWDMLQYPWIHMILMKPPSRVLTIKSIYKVWHCFGIWHEALQHCCRATCQISKQSVDCIITMTD